ncbi:helix-turn-helix domain-containing protein [Schleiferilactobacillus shenzhenensis]|uniref:HTH cro/C1-type domain-containing protein n=1 Tax=Schleiferilactobacillus shenzhenensis LY-73 TaxID=1231336 RepID=U4TRK5_9LACO|nr:helix-turn-helix transcriptional regulator [Schleiferilactobacillus shenzhenensis]ERL64137.1 hypothetical protein L248_1579 [Schleiferilactobacillus shenzhenensis LY-73]
MELGEFMRHQRQDVGLTIHQVTHDIMPDSVLSRFERGETELGAKSFVQILTRLDGNIDFLQQSFLTANKTFYHYPIDDTLTPDVYPAQIVYFQKLWEETQWPYYRLAAILFIAIADVYHIENFHLTDDMLGRAVHHLAHISRWGQFEVTLINAVSPFLKADQVQTLADRIFEQINAESNYYALHSRNSRYHNLISAAQGMFNAAYLQRNITLAETIFSELDTVRPLPSMVQEKNRFVEMIILDLYHHPNEEKRVTARLVQMYQGFRGTRYNYSRTAQLDAWPQVAANVQKWGWADGH